MLKLKYYYHDDFLKLNDEILKLNLTNDDIKTCQTISSQAAYVDNLYKKQKYLLTKSGEHKLFLKYNYCKYKLSNMANITKNEIEYKEAIATRNSIVEGNIRSCLSLIQKYAINGHYDEYLSESFNTLLLAIDAFNFTFGYSFSTYLWPSVQNKLKNLHKQTRRQKRNADRTESLTFDVHDTYEDPEFDDTDYKKLKRLLMSLSDRERNVVIDHYYNNITYKEIGDKYGLTRERIRQISSKAVDKLKEKWEASNSDNLKESICNNVN